MLREHHRPLAPGLRLRRGPPGGCWGEREWPVPRRASGVEPPYARHDGRLRRRWSVGEDGPSAGQRHRGHHRGASRVHRGQYGHGQATRNEHHRAGQERDAHEREAPQHLPRPDHSDGAGARRRVRDHEHWNGVQGGEQHRNGGRAPVQPARGGGLAHRFGDAEHDWRPRGVE